MKQVVRIAKKKAITELAKNKLYEDTATKTTLKQLFYKMVDEPYSYENEITDERVLEKFDNNYRNYKNLGKQLESERIDLVSKEKGINAYLQDRITLNFYPEETPTHEEEIWQNYLNIFRSLLDRARWNIWTGCKTRIVILLYNEMIYKQVKEMAVFNECILLAGRGFVQGGDFIGLNYKLRRDYKDVDKLVFIVIKDYERDLDKDNLKDRLTKYLAKGREDINIVIDEVLTAEIILEHKVKHTYDNEDKYELEAVPQKILYRLISEKIGYYFDKEQPEFNMSGYLDSIKLLRTSLKKRLNDMIKADREVNKNEEHKES